jgi:hypothetical protein
MTNQFIKSIVTWAILISTGVLLLQASNFSLNSSSNKSSLFEVTCWVLGGLIVVAATICPGYLLSKSSLDSQSNLIKASIIMSFPIFVLVILGRNSDLDLVQKSLIALLMWALFVAINFGCVWAGSKLARSGAKS